MAAWVSAPAVALAQSHEAAGVGDGLSVVVSLGIGASVQGSCPRAAPCPVKPFGDASASHRSGGAQGVPAVAQSPIGSPSGVGVALRPSPKPFPKLRVGLAWGVVQPPSKAVQPVWEGASMQSRIRRLFWIDAESKHDQNSRRTCSARAGSSVVRCFAQ